GESAEDDSGEGGGLRLTQEVPDRDNAGEAAEPQADAAEVRGIRRDPDARDHRDGRGMGPDAGRDDGGEGEHEGGLDRPAGRLRAFHTGSGKRAGEEDEETDSDNDPGSDRLDVRGVQEPLAALRSLQS